MMAQEEWGLVQLGSQNSPSSHVFQQSELSTYTNVIVVKTLSKPCSVPAE